MGRDLTAYAWPLARLGDALATLSSEARSSEPPAAPDPATLDSEALDRWIAAAAARFDIEVEPATLPYSALANSLKAAAPALLRIPIGFLLLTGKGRVLGPDLSTHRVSPHDLAAALSQELEAPIASEVDRMLDGVPSRRRAKVRAAIVRERLLSRQISGCWLLRLPPGASFRRQLRDAGVQRRLAALASAHLLQYALFIGSWWVLGDAVLEGRIERAWLLAWMLLLLTIVPLRMLATWLQGAIAIRAGAILKQRLLAGALSLEPDEIRSEGAGQLLGRVLESQQVEALALSGGFLAMVSGIELLLAIVVLAAGNGWMEPALLVLWIAATFAIARRYLASNELWTGMRLDMTHDLVEKMVGHRTRLAQQRREDWHAGEDEAVDRYLNVSTILDRAAARLTAVVPRGWLLVGIAAIAPGFVSGAASASQLAITVGGVLLAWRALMRLSGGLWQIAGALIAWNRTALLFHAAEVGQAFSLPTGREPGAEGASDPRPLFEASRVVFRYRPTGEPILRGCNLRIEHGDRLLLEGPSGGGKSTLAAIATGMRTPQSGDVLLHGLDRRALGSESWRRAIVSAPQFHENHVLTGTFAFNLMMGCRWPPRPDDFEEMETICRELGLDELLARMPAGLQQSVGDTGWQLSHGERSRLYIARALLQKADLIVFDESFAALDPENLRRAVNCVSRRARSVMVIAHP